MSCWRFISVPAYCSFACSGYVKYWSILWQTLWLCGTFAPRLLLQFFWWLILEDGINLIQSLQAETRLVWYSTLKCHCLRMLLCLTRICFRHSSYQRIKIVPPFSTSRVRSIGIGFVPFITLFSTRPVCYPFISNLDSNKFDKTIPMHFTDHEKCYNHLYIKVFSCSGKYKLALFLCLPAFKYLKLSY